ncbi:MAG: replicative DNA helicase [Treponema bryantii]|nr:replicative DNA helicase [Treponema bryantii]
MDINLSDKVPPHSIESEQAVLGAILLDWDSMSEVVTTLKPEKFYSLQNQLIYEALFKLFTKNIKGDTLSLINKLTEDGKLEQAGGTAYIASLTDKVPSSENIEYYANVVKDRATRRDLIKATSEIRSSAFELNQESNLILDQAEKKIFALAEHSEMSVIHDVKNVMIQEIDLIEKRFKSKNQFTGVPTGFANLDSMTSGFQNSDLIILGARPSIGKTAMALSMMQHISLDRKIPCGFFSLEMSTELIGMRILAQESRVSMSKIRSGMIKIDEIQKIQDAAGRWFEAPLYIVDTPNMRLLELRSMARRMVEKHGVKIIFIDYIGLIATDNPTAPVFEQVSEISKSLKALARELKIPIVALSQVSRNAEGEEPNLAQLRGSGSVEQDADVVMFLHRERLKDESPIQDAKLILAKQRNGATGDIKIKFIPAYSKFENAAKEED